MDTVSHSIVVLFTRRESSQFSSLINIELKISQVASTCEERPEFFLIWIWLNIYEQVQQIFLCKPKFFQLTGFEKALGIAQWSRLAIAQTWSYSKLVGWSPSCNSRNISGFSQLEVSSSAGPVLHQHVYELVHLRQGNLFGKFEWLY